MCLAWPVAFLGLLEPIFVLIQTDLHLLETCWIWLKPVSSWFSWAWFPNMALELPVRQSLDSIPTIYAQRSRGTPEPQSEGQREINTRLGFHKGHSFTLQGRRIHCNANLQFVTVGIYCYLPTKIRYFKLSRKITLVHLFQVFHLILKPMLFFLFWVFEEISELSPQKNIYTHAP